MDILQDKLGPSSGKRAERLLSAGARSLFVFMMLVSLNCARSRAQVRPYFGVIGGIATLSADAGSQSTATGLNLSSYAPSNGGALDVFGGASLHNYLSL